MSRVDDNRARKKLRKKRKRNRVLAIIAILTLTATGYFVGNKFLFKEDKRANQVSKEKKEEKKKETVETSSSSEVKAIKPTTKIRPKKEKIKGNLMTLDDTELKHAATNVYYGVHYFKTGDYATSNNSKQTVAASIIKVFIMEYAYVKAEENVISLEEMINGSTLSDLIQQMIQSSNNEATNLLIDHFGMNPLNEFFVSRGYKETKIERKMLDNEARNQGLDNYTSLDDSMLFLKKIYENQKETPYSSMLEIMKGQTIKTKIPLVLPNEIVVANKTGELEGVENDIGIVFSKNNPFAIVVLTNQALDVNMTRTAIANLALQAYEKE